MKRTISILITFVMLLTMIPATANALVIDDWEIEISNGEAYIIGFNGTCPDKMILPTQIGNFSVVGLKRNIFTENVTEITVPEGYRVISMKMSVVGDYLGTIKDKLKKITLPSTLQTMDLNFKNCVKLKEIKIPGGVKKLPDSIFEGCSSLKYVHLENGLESIGMRAFSGCVNLVDFTIPSTVTEIGGEAFNDCDSLVNMVIPNSVHTFGKDYTKSNIGIWDRAVFSNCDNLETVVLSDNIKILCSSHIGGAGELSNCPKLKSVYIGNSVKEFQNSPDAYYGILGGCNSLKTVIIPENVTTIGSCSFKDDNNLEAVVLPKSFSDVQSNLKKATPFYQYEGFNAKQPLPKLYLYGYKGTYAETFANEGGFPFVDISVAKPTKSRVLINGKDVAFIAYNIGGNNYFKLRDIAAAINGTAKNFNVGWDGANKTIKLTSRSGYTNVGGELVVNTKATATEPKISNPKIFVDGTLTTFMAFNIAGNNYIKLRDLGEVFDFGVDWNNSTQTIEINTNKGYIK
ncbi:MAG: leucine-rich repeat protein [Oscillospiraceae bacterium]|nr:leucine-rich repeat protein [Oscillospiraceae bacterium]